MFVVFVYLRLHVTTPPILWLVCFVLLQTCLLNMTNMAFPIIFCMESSTDVLGSVESVRTVCVSVYVHAFRCVCSWPPVACSA